MRKAEREEEEKREKGEQQHHQDQDCFSKILKSYSWFLVHYPLVVIFGTYAIVGLAIALSTLPQLGAKPLPNFAEPLKGMEARGTMLSSRFMALRNLRRFANPSNASDASRTILTIVDLPLTGNPFHLEKFIEGFDMIFERQDRGDLFPHIKDLCYWYKRHVEDLPQYEKYVRFLHHIPNYIAWIYGKKDCRNITDEDTTSFKELLQTCVPYYTNRTFLNCRDNATQCSHIQKNCLETNSIIPNQQDVAALFHNVFHFLADKTFTDDPSILKTTMVVAVLRSIDEIEKNLFDVIYQQELEDIDDPKFREVKIAAYNMWMYKPWLFGRKLFQQCVFSVIAIVFVVLLTWFYSGSIFIGCTTLFCIIAAIIVSYFVYGRIFDLDFFPFSNINTIIFIIGIGADDVFVYTQIYKEAQELFKVRKRENHIEYLIKWTSYSLRHAIIAMLVTSLTTAVSFYSNLTSSITTVKCFGLYAGTSIILNYILMFTYLPCAFIVHERYLSKCTQTCCSVVCCRPSVVEDSAKNNESRSFGNIFMTSLSQFNNNLFSRVLPGIVCKYKHFFVAVLSLFGIGSFLVIFYKPGLHPPLGGSFQLFQNRSTIEKYDMEYRYKFALSQSHGQMPIEVYFVFGVEPIDNGNYLDPSKMGTITFKNPIDLFDLKSLLFVDSFCANIRTSDIFDENIGCNQLDAFQAWLGEDCSKTRMNCCSQNFNQTKKEFLLCIKSFLTMEAKLNRTGILPVLDKEERLRALILPVTTNYVFSLEYEYNKHVVQKLEDWTTSAMEEAPFESLKGWWIGQMFFYDLQESLDNGTFSSMGFAVAAAFVVILLTSRNVILSIYSVITMVFIISMTIGALVLDGWHLNLTESSIFSVAAGLSADFTLHYSVAYRNSPLSDRRESKVQQSLKHVGAPIIMGALTTFFGGLVMMPSTIRAYVQVGEFLMIVMAFSWIFSTFFFLPLCAIAGPTGFAGELNCCRSRRKKEIKTTELGVTNTASDANVIENTYKA